MSGHVKQCVERHLELAKCSLKSLKKVTTPCMDDHAFGEGDFTSRGELSEVASRIVLKALYVARLGRPDILWTVNYLARHVTKWTKACDRRLHRLISYMHHTAHHTQMCFVGDNQSNVNWLCFVMPVLQGNWKTPSPPLGHTCV